jgi:hypothetical protein
VTETEGGNLARVRMSFYIAVGMGYLKEQNNRSEGRKLSAT